MTDWTGKIEATQRLIERPWKGLYIAFVLVGAVSVTAALMVAFGGFKWGLPDKTHIHSYHPDEQNVPSSLSNMRPSEFDFNPRFWGNPTFYTYQMGALAYLAGKTGLLPDETSAEYYLGHPEAVRRFYILGREFSFAYTALSAVLVYMVARRASRSRFAPVMAVVVFVSLPVTAVHSHYMTVNASSVFWSLATVLFALKLQEEPAWRNYILAGVCAGFAISTKLNTAFVPLAILTAHALSCEGGSAGRVLGSRKLWTAAALTVAAFVIGSPYYVLAFREVMASSHNRMNWGALLDFSVPVTIVLKDFWNHLSAACGWVLGPILLLALPVAAAVKKRRSLAPILVVALPFLAVAVKSGWWAFPSRMWPMLALAAIVVAALLFDTGKQFLAGLLAAPVMAGLLVAALWNVAYLNMARTEHVRKQSSDWIVANIEPGSRIAVLNTPYFESPDIIYENALRAAHFTGVRFEVEDLKGDFAALASSSAPWLVIPERYDRVLREETGMGVAEFAQSHGFVLAVSFSAEFQAFGVSLRSWVPADMVQNYPVFIFARKVATPLVE